MLRCDVAMLSCLLAELSKYCTWSKLIDICVGRDGGYKLTIIRGVVFIIFIQYTKCIIYLVYRNIVFSVFCKYILVLSPPKQMLHYQIYLVDLKAQSKMSTWHLFSWSFCFQSILCYLKFNVNFWEYVVFLTVLQEWFLVCHF